MSLTLSLPEGAQELSHETLSNSLLLSNVQALATNRGKVTLPLSYPHLKLWMDHVQGRVCCDQRSTGELCELVKVS